MSLIKLSSLPENAKTGDLINLKEDYLELEANEVYIVVNAEELTVKKIPKDSSNVENAGGTTIKGTWEPESTGLEFDPNYNGDFGENEQISVQNNEAILSNEEYQQITFLDVHDLTEGIELKYKISEKIEHGFTLYSSGMGTVLEVKEDSLSFNISPTDTISIDWNQNEEITLYISYEESSGKFKAIFNEEVLEIEAGMFNGIFNTQSIIYATDGEGEGEYTLELLSEFSYPQDFQNNAFTVVGETLQPLAKEGDIVIGNATGDGIALVIPKESQSSGSGGSALKDVNSKSSNFSVNESNQGEFFKLTNDLVITLDSVQTDRMFKIEFKSQGNHNIIFEDSSGSSILDQYGFGQITNKGFVTQLWDGSEWSIDGGLDLIEP